MKTNVITKENYYFLRRTARWNRIRKLVNLKWDAIDRACGNATQIELCSDDIIDAETGEVLVMLPDFFKESELWDVSYYIEHIFVPAYNEFFQQ